MYKLMTSGSTLQVAKSDLLHLISKPTEFFGHWSKKLELRILLRDKVGG